MANAETRIAAIESLLLKVADELLALKAELAGERTEGQQARDTVEEFRKRWKAMHSGETYVVTNWAAATVAMKKLIKELGQAEVIRRMPRYFSNGDPFYTKNRHPLHSFCRDISKFGAGRRLEESATDDRDDDDAPADCKHSPTCKTDAACTRLKSQELRR